jgi:hypothetical protein
MSFVKFRVIFHIQMSIEYSIQLTTKSFPNCCLPKRNFEENSVKIEVNFCLVGWNRHDVLTNLQSICSERSNFLSFSSSNYLEQKFLIIYNFQRAIQNKALYQWLICRIEDLKMVRPTQSGLLSLYVSSYG